MYAETQTTIAANNHCKMFDSYDIAYMTRKAVGGLIPFSLSAMSLSRKTNCYNFWLALLEKFHSHARLRLFDSSGFERFGVFCSKI